MDTVIEEILADVNKPSEVMKRIGTKHYWRLHEGDKTRVRVILWKKFRHLSQFTDAQLNDVFMSCINTRPGNFPEIQDHIIPGTLVENLQTVVIGGEHAGDHIIRVIPFHAIDWPGSTLTLVASSPRPRSLSDARSDACRPLVNTCRKLANVMYMLNIFGDRFIKARDLIDSFHQGSQIGTQCEPKKRSQVLNHISSFTANELWSTVEPGRGHITVTKWIAEHGFPEDGMEFDAYYFQINFV